MSEQPPVQPPSTPPHQPFNQPPESNSPTQPMTATYAAPVPGPTAGRPAGPAPVYPPTTSRWQRATSTTGRRWALALSAAAVALLLVLGIGVTSFLVLRNHDQVSLLGNRQPTRSLGQYGPGNGQGPRANGGKNGRHVQGTPGGRIQGLAGLGNLLGGTALHGDVTASAGGSVQALVFQRGQVTALSGTSVTLKSSDGFAGTYALSATTRSRGASLVNGGQAFVLARASDKVAIATMPAPVGAAPSS